MHVYFSKEEAARIIKADERHIGWYIKYGLLGAIRTGQGYLIRDDAIDQFWDTYQGLDLNTERAIRVYGSKNKKDCTSRSKV